MHWIKLANRILGLTVGTLLAAWLVTTVGPSRERLALVVVFSAGALSLLEAGLLRRRIHNDRRDLEELRTRTESSKDEPDQNRKHADEREISELQFRVAINSAREAWCWRAGIALLSVLFLCVTQWCVSEPQTRSNDQIGLRLDQIQNILSIISHSPYSNSGNQVPPEVTLKLDPALQAYLMENVHRVGSGDVIKQGPLDVTLKLDPALEARLKANLPGPSASTNRWLWALLIVAVIATAVLLFWALTQKPEGTPLTAAIAVLTATGAVIAKLIVDKPLQPLSQVPVLVWAISGSLLIAGVVLLGAGTWCLVKPLKEGHQSSQEGQTVRLASHEDRIGKASLLGAALLVYGFAAFLMALLPPLLLRGETTKETDCSKCPVKSAILPASDFTVKSLTAITGLGDGGRTEGKRIDLKQISMLEEDLKIAKTNDVLLLFGSADCKPTRPKPLGLWESNDALAKARASWVLESLQGKLGSVSSTPSSLPQAVRCAQALDKRAVYPFLIHAENIPPKETTKTP